MRHLGRTLSSRGRNVDRGTNPRLFTAESEYTALLVFGALADLFAALARVAELECKLAGARMTTAKPGLH